MIQARDEQAVRATLLGLSGDLLALHESLADLKLKDEGLEGRRGELMLDSIALTALLRALLRVLDGLAGQSPQPQGAFR